MYETEITRGVSVVRPRAPSPQHNNTHKLCRCHATKRDTKLSCLCFHKHNEQPTRSCIVCWSRGSADVPSRSTGPQCLAAHDTDGGALRTSRANWRRDVRASIPRSLSRLWENRCVEKDENTPRGLLGYALAIHPGN